MSDVQAQSPEKQAEEAQLRAVWANPTEEEFCLANEYYNNRYEGCGADTVSVTSPGATTGIDFELEPAGSVTGQLLDDSGFGLQGATVCAINGDSMSEVSYEGVGCSICMASANMLCEALGGATVTDAHELLSKVKGMLTRAEDPEFPDAASDLEALRGVRNFPVRVKCALLAWNTLGEILEDIDSADDSSAES